MRIPRILAYFRRFVFAVFVTALTFLSPAFGDTFLYNDTPVESKFYVTTTSGVAGKTVKLYIKATGTFYIDWGDGNVTPHTTNSSSAAISHSYASGTCSSGCKIRFGWLSEPTDYPTGTGTTYAVSAISFYNAAADGLYKYIASIGGSLGALFPTLDFTFTQVATMPTASAELLGNVYQYIGTTSGSYTKWSYYKCVQGNSGYSWQQVGRQPRFISTFQGSTNLTGSIPSGLFSGLSGPFSENMFRQTFYQCSGLTGYVPDDLFADLEKTSDTNVGNVMYRTFYGASSMAQTCPTGTHNSESYNAYGSNWKTTTSATPTVVSCSLCPAGTYNDQTGQTSCTSCSSIGDGSYTESEIGATADSQCYKTATTSCPCSVAHASSCSGTTDCIEYYNSGTCSIIDSNVCDVVSVTCESGYKSTAAGTACEPITYSISFNGNGSTGGSTSGMSNLSYGSPYTLTSNGFTRTGYDFDGWCVGATTCATADKLANSASVSNLTTTDGATITLYAQWTPTPYTITLNPNGGTLDSGVVNPISYNIESGTVNLPDDPYITQLGYIFDGWCETIDCDSGNETPIKQFVPTSSNIGDKNMYAQWTSNACDITNHWIPDPNNLNNCICVTGYTDISGVCTPTSYTITYNTNGGTLSGTYPTDYTIESNTITLPDDTNITKLGYSFAGWYDNAGLTGTAVTSIATGSTGNKVYYASWTANTYNVTYTCDGETAQEDTATYDVSYSVRDSATVCAAQGYTPSLFTCVPNISSGVWNTDSDVVCSATRTGNTINLTWTNGGHGTAPSTPDKCTYGSTITMPVALTETGWTFNNWGVNGKTFNGGQQNIVCNYDNLGVSANNATATITASWTANTINLTWTNGGHGTAPTTPTSCKYGSTFDMPAALTEIGWTFNKWNVNGNQFNGGATGVVCNYDNLGVSANNATATITADWTLNTYTITYDTNSGSAVSNDTYDIMDTQPDGYNLATTSKTGYTFDGWCVYDSVQSTAPTTCNNSILMTKLSSGTTGNKWAYAKWTATPYTITYDVKGGVAIANGSYTIESGTITLPTATKTNSDFVGWCTEDSELNPNCTILSGNQFTPDSADLGDKTFYAKWIIHCATGSIPNESNTACVCDVDGGYGSFAGTLEECTGTNRKLVYWNESDNVCYDNNENTSSSMCAGMYKRDWIISFKQNNVQKRYKGVAWCDSRNMGDVSEGSKSLPALGTPVGTPGNSCWCRIETYEPNVDNGTKLNVFVWLQILHKNSLSSCQENCADMCGSMIGHFGSDYSTLRLITNVLQNNVSPCVYSCPEGTSVNITNDGCVADSCTDSNNDGICDSVGGCASGYKFNSVTQECDLVEYTINYEEKGGEEVSDGRYTVLSPSVSLPTTTRTGYMFAGWCTEDSELNPNCTVLTNNTFVPDSSDLDDKTFYAKWTPITYTITYYTNDGTLDSGINNPTNYTIESSTITLPTGMEITRTGYVFAGWYNNPSLTGTAVTSVPGGSYGNKEYYAQWLNCASVTPDHATASVNVVDNACVYTITCDTGWSHHDTNSVPDEYVIDNIVYTGVAGELPSGITGCETPRVNLTWNPESADNAASVSGVGFCDVGATFNVPTTEPARTGYTFVGWDVTSVTPSAGNGE